MAINSARPGRERLNLVQVRQRLEQERQKPEQDRQKPEQEKQKPEQEGRGQSSTANCIQKSYTPNSKRNTSKSYGWTKRYVNRVCYIVKEPTLFGDRLMELFKGSTIHVNLSEVEKWKICKSKVYPKLKGGLD